MLLVLIFSLFLMRKKVDRTQDVEKKNRLALLAWWMCVCFITTHPTFVSSTVFVWKQGGVLMEIVW